MSDNHHKQRMYRVTANDAVKVVTAAQRAVAPRRLTRSQYDLWREALRLTSQTTPPPSSATLLKLFGSWPVVRAAANGGSR